MRLASIAGAAARLTDGKQSLVKTSVDEVDKLFMRPPWLEIKAISSGLVSKAVEASGLPTPTSFQAKNCYPWEFWGSSA